MKEKREERRSESWLRKGEIFGGESMDSRGEPMKGEGRPNRVPGAFSEIYESEMAAQMIYPSSCYLMDVTKADKEHA
jgi:hypothetical protein